MNYKVIRIYGVVMLVLGAAAIILQIMAGGEISHWIDRRGWDADLDRRHFAWPLT